MSENNLDTFSTVFEAVTGHTIDQHVQGMITSGDALHDLMGMPAIAVLPEPPAAEVTDEGVLRWIPEHDPYEEMAWIPFNEAEALPTPFATPAPAPDLNFEDMSIHQLHEHGIIDAGLVEQFDEAVDAADFDTVGLIMGVVSAAITAHQQSIPNNEGEVLVPREMTPEDIQLKWLDDRRTELKAAIANVLPIGTDFGSVRFNSVVQCFMCAAKDNAQLESFISFIQDGGKEAVEYIKLFADTLQGLSREAIEEMQQCDVNYGDFFKVVHAKLGGIVEYSPENVKLLAGVDSPILKSEVPPGLSITAAQAYCMSDIFAMYAAYVLTCTSDEYANGKYQEYDETLRTEIEHINVHCLSVLGVNSFVHRNVGIGENEMRYSPLYSKIENNHTRLTNRALFVILLGMYRGTLVEDIFNWSMETVEARKHIIEEDGLNTLGAVEDGMRRLTTAKGSWQAMISILAPFSVFPMVTESIDMASYSMLENYKKTKMFSFSLMTMQSTMFSYLLRNDSDMSVLGSIQALQSHIERFIGSEVKLPKETENEVETFGETTILTSNTSKLLTTLYGHKLPEFKAANPHIMFT